MSILGKLGYSLIVALIGLMIVFVGLIILIACIYALAAVMRKVRERAEAKKPAAPAPAPVVVPEPVAEAAAEEAQVDEGELVAVITAALMAYTKSNKTLVVKNIRRANAWASAGRADQLTRF